VERSFALVFKNPALQSASAFRSKYPFGGLLPLPVVRVPSGGVESGEVWFSKITKSLAETKVGILCLTPENKENPWIMFEAGALMKGLEKSRVHILLMDLKKKM
jgi:hypothetical protein